MSAWTSIGVVANAPPRGGGSQAVRTFTAQSIQIATAWGANPGTAIITYIGTSVPVTTGAELTITAGAHVFYGVCRADTLVDSSRGLTRTLEFADFREYLAWDVVFGCFNKVETRLVDGQRVRRYWHIYPADFLSMAKTYTTAPLTVAEILDALFGADTVLTRWTRVYHEDQFISPVYDVDCMGGKTLAAVAQELSDKQGLVFTVAGGPYRLIWVRKGVGVLPSFPANADDRKTGTALSGNATRVRVIGDRNVYQVMNVPLVPDWESAWETFLILEVFEDDIFKRGTDPVTGRRFNAFLGDAEQFIGRQAAAYYAKTITVRQYVALRNAVRLSGELANDGNRFADYRKFHSRSRMDMPAALYIRTLLFRAFRPDLMGFTNVYGQTVPLDSVSIADRLLQAVSHHPTTGLMTVVPSEPADGNGYAVVKGYQIGRDLFRTLRPEQFSTEFFKDAKAFWQSTPFQWDDSGDERFVIFDEPVVVSEDLLTLVNGHAVIRADFTLVVPAARISMVMEAERYAYTLGDPGRDVVEQVSGLNGEFIVDGAAVTELPYDDGFYSDDKGFEIAEVLRQQQFYYASGSYVVKGTNGTQLTSVIDRVSVAVSPRGTLETVDFTNERRPAVEPGARDLDRRIRERELLPGQAELRSEANMNALLARGLRQSPGFVRFLSDFLSGTVDGEGKVFEGVMVRNGGETLLAAGTPLRRGPVTVGTTVNTGTLAVLPAAATATDTIFAGVVLRQNEVAGRPFKVQTGGIAMVRVQGPVEPNDAVGLSATPTADYLTKDGTPGIGLAHGRISDGTVKLIPVRIGAGGGNPGVLQRFKVVAVLGDYLVCLKALEDGSTPDPTQYLIAKPEHLRRSTWHGRSLGGFAYSVSDDGNIRTATLGNARIIDRVDPEYVAGQTDLFASKATGRTAVAVSGVRLEWIDVNVDGRHFEMDKQVVAVCINNDNNWRMYVQGSAPFRP